MPTVHATRQKLWGSELWIVNTDDYCGKKLTLRRNTQSSLHYHEVKEETFWVQNGLVRFEKDAEVLMLGPGESVHVPPGCIHRFTGIRDSEIFEFSTHHDDDDTYRIELSRVVATTTSIEPPRPLPSELFRKG